jgi:hypothetical protein
MQLAAASAAAAEAAAGRGWGAGGYDREEDAAAAVPAAAAATSSRLKLKLKLPAPPCNLRRHQHQQQLSTSSARWSRVLTNSSVNLMPSWGVRKARCSSSSSQRRPRGVLHTLNLLQLLTGVAGDALAAGAATLGASQRQAPRPHAAVAAAAGYYGVCADKAQTTYTASVYKASTTDAGCG